MNNDYFYKMLMSAFDSKMIRKKILKKLDAKLYESIVKNVDDELEAVKIRKYQWSSSLLNRVVQNIGKGYISKRVLNKLTDVFIEGAFHSEKNFYRERVAQYEKQNGVKPPSFLVISPTQRCNLKCTGCYACSDSKRSPKLNFETFRKIIKEFRTEAEGRFVVISGGEPLMYEDDNKNILNVFEEFDDVFFMFYTNGTLINKEVAEKLGRLGNAVPAISIEGFEKETDERRGKGVHKKILNASAYLRDAGVPFIFSVTANSQNTNLLLTDKFYDYYFEEVGASFMWQFQLMPIGRGKEIFELMPSPEQRVQLFRKWENLMMKKKYPLADFWNSGVLVQGCIAYGRTGGYFYVDWNGNIMPCVFVPYVVGNVYELYNRGKSLFEVLKAPMMKNGRNWQYETQLKDNMNPHNLLMPCSIRDHYNNFRKNIMTPGVKGENEVADDILRDKDYYENMVKYDNELNERTQKLWETEYLN